MAISKTDTRKHMQFVRQTSHLHAKCAFLQVIHLITVVCGVNQAEKHLKHSLAFFHLVLLVLYQMFTNEEKPCW